MLVNPKTMNALIKWISASPELYHPCDIKRFFEVEITAREHNDLTSLLRLPWIPILNECQPLWDKKFKIKFEEEWKQRISIYAEYIRCLKDS